MLITDEIKNLYESAGISMKGGNISRLEDTNLKTELKKLYRIIDEQDAVNRFLWYNLPVNLSSTELERLLYYKGQLCFFYCKELNMFLFTPYTLNEGLDFYGRYTYVSPVPIVDEKNKLYARQKALLSTYKLRVVYGLWELDSLQENEDYCILLNDYTKQLAETIIPRRYLQESLIDTMSYMIPYAKTALMNSTGVSGMRVNNADEYSNVEAASRSVDKAALNSKKWIAVEGNIDFQDLTTKGTTNGAEPFLLMLQSLDNIRKSTYGIESGGIYDKKSYVNTTQAQLTGTGNQISSPLQDSLYLREQFCLLANAIFGTGISCQVNQVILNSMPDNSLFGSDNNNQEEVQESEETESE